MTDKTFIIGQLMIFGALFLWYLSSGNPEYLVFCLAIIGVLIATTNLINFSQISYYVALLVILLFQSMIIINTYLLKTTPLQNIGQYVTLVFALFAYIATIALVFKPNIFKKSSKKQE